MTRPTMEELRAKLGQMDKRYGDIPGTGPAGATCKTCAFLRYTGNVKHYPKCGKTKYTHGDATTIKTSSPACRLYQREGYAPSIKDLERGPGKP